MRILALIFCFGAVVWHGVCQGQPQFRTDVQLVMVDVQVTEKGTGKVLEFLGPQDFVIYDNGQIRPVREFYFETTPLDVVFLLYGQMWVSPKEVNDVRKGLNDAVAQLRTTDRTAVLRGHSESNVGISMTNDHEAIRRALLEVDRGRLAHTGLSRSDKLNDAIMVATTLFPQPKDRGRRRAVVAVTTDTEQRSKVKLEPLITELLEADATLNGIVLVGDPGGVRVEFPSQVGRVRERPLEACRLRENPFAPQSMRPEGKHFREINFAKGCRS